MISKNPLDYITEQDIIDLDLTPDDLINSYQPSEGGVYHARGAEGLGKTLWIAHFYRDLVDRGIKLPSDAVGNLTFKGIYGERYGYTVLKGDDLRAYLWDMIHKPYTGKIVIIDEIDSEFPARSFTDREQTEIASRMWHVQKLGNYILMTSHLGNSTDLIFHLSSHYYIYPQRPDFENNSLDYTLDNWLDMTTEDGIAYDIIKTMLIYNRKELTEKTEEEQNKQRPIKKNKKEKLQIIDDLDFELEIEKGLSSLE